MSTSPLRVDALNIDSVFISESVGGCLLDIVKAFSRPLPFWILQGVPSCEMRHLRVWNPSLHRNVMCFQNIFFFVNIKQNHKCCSGKIIEFAYRNLCFKIKHLIFQIRESDKIQPLCNYVVLIYFKFS